MGGAPIPGCPEPLSFTAIRAMTIRDENVSRGAAVARETITLGRDDVAANQAAVLVDAYRPGFPFRIVDVQHFAGGVGPNASYDVRINAATALNAAAVPAAGARGNAVLAASESALTGDADDVINLHVTTDGTGSLADLSVKIGIVPRDLDWRT